ncbi:hypothetical protein MPER_00164, partial [Moniliophthora perniciosa FA553]
MDPTLIHGKFSGIAVLGDHTTLRASQGWHADITFEQVPSDYAVLKIHTLPE